MGSIRRVTKNGKIYTYNGDKLIHVYTTKKTEYNSTAGAQGQAVSSIKPAQNQTNTVQGGKSTSQNSLTAKGQNTGFGGVKVTGTAKKSGAETAQKIGRDMYAQNHQGRTYVAGSGNQERKLDSKKYYMGNSDTAKAANEYERANDELKIYDQEHSWVNTVNQQQDALRRGDDAALSAATQQGKQNSAERSALAKKASDAQEKVFSAQRKEVYDTTNAKADTAASSDPNYSATVQKGLQNEKIQGSGNGLTITGMRETASPDRRDVTVEELQGDWLEASELLTNRLNSVGDVDAYKQTEEYKRLHADSETKRKKYNQYMDDTSWYGYAKKFGVLDQLGYAAATLNEKDFDAYFKNLQLDLTAKGAEQQEKELKDITGGDNPNALQRGTAAIMNVALQTSPTAGADYGDTLGKSIYNATHDVEERLPTNPYGNTGQARLQNLTQEQANVGLNDVQKFFMNAGLSSASMVLGAATGGGAYIYNQGLGAGSQAAQDALEKGGDYGQAAATGTAAAAAATLMEKVGIDNIFGAVGELGINGSTAKNIAKAFLKSAASEGTEEAGEEVVNIVADMLVMGDKSDVQQYLNDYINNNQNSTKAQQDAALAMYAFSRIGQNALAGAITGGAFGGATMLGAYGDYGTAATAEDVKSLYRESAKENGIDLTGKSEKGIAVGAAQELITQAYSKEAKKAVETAQKQIEIKHEVSDAALTNLFNTVMSEKNRTAAQKAVDADAYINAGTDFYLKNPVEETISTPVLDKYAGGQNVDAILGRMYTTNMPTIERMAGKEAVLNAGGKEVAPTGKDVKMPTRREAGSIEITEPGNRARYENEIDGVFNGKLPLGSEIIMGRTPETLTLYGAPDLPLHMTQATARKIAYPKGHQGGEHNLGIEALKQLPDHLSNPIAILESKTQPNSHVVLTEWNDTNGNRVVVPIHFNKNGTMTVQNKIASAYGKEGINALLGENNENVIYTKNNEDIQSLLSHGLQLPEASRDDVFYNPNISQDTPGVKNSIFWNRENDTENPKYDIMSEKGDSDQEYTDKNTVTKYKGFDAYNLNYQLNNGQELDADSLKWSNELSDALSSLPDYNGHTYRTLVFDDFGGKDAYDAFVSKHVIGYEVTYNGFTSSVKSENGYPIDGQYKVFLRIDGAHGKDIGTMLPGQQDAEGEVLFDKKSIFIPTKIYEQNGVLNIEIKEVAESEDAFSSGKKSMVSAVSERNTPSAMQQVRTSGKRINGGQQTGVQSVSAGNTESNNGRGREPLRGALSGGQRDIGGKERIAETAVREDGISLLSEQQVKSGTKNLVMTEMPKKSSAERSEKAAEAGDWAMRKFVDTGYTFQRAGRVAKDNSLYDLYDNARRSRQSAAFTIGYTATGQKTYQADLYGKKMGESLQSIFLPVIKADKKTKGYRQEFFDYLLNYHNIDRMAQGKPVFGESVTAEQSRAIVAEYERVHPEFKDIAKQVWKYNDNALEIRVQGGLISQEQADAMRERYPHYVPTFRDMTSIKGGYAQGNKAAVNKGIKQATGSDLPIIPIDDAMAQQTQQAYSAAAQNTLLSRLYDDYLSDPDRMGVFVNDVREKIGLEYDIDDATGTVFAERKKTDLPNTATFYKNGKAMTMVVDSGIFEGISSLGGSPDILKPLTSINNMYKRFITSYNPAFLIRNFVRDMQDSLFYTSNVHGFLKNYVKAWKEITSNGELWQQYQALGGFNSSMFDSAKGVRDSEHNIVQRFTLDKIEAANMFIEQAPRFAEFMNILEQEGKTNGEYSRETLAKAMQGAADITVNFGKSGSVTKVLNRSFVPFLNPSVQGAEKFIRQFKNKGGKAWLYLAGKAAVLGVLPAILNAMLYRDDDEYASMPQHTKDNYYLFKLSDGNWLKIPKGRILGLFGGLATRVGDAAQGKGFDEKGMIDLIINNAAPNNPFTSNIFSPIINAVNNKTWYGGNIEKQSMQNLRPADRYDESTDAISKWIGKTFNISPKRVHYVLDAYSGVIGDFALPLLTQKAEKKAFISDFIVDPVYTNNISDLFYSAKEELGYTVQSEPESNVKSVNAWVLSYMDKQQSMASNLYKEISKIQNSDLPDAEKASQSRIIQQTINGIYQTATATQDILRKNIEKYYQVDPNASENSQIAQSQKAYTQAYRDTFGPDVAIKETLGKETYEKAKASGAAYDDYLDYYLYTKPSTDNYLSEDNTLEMSKADKKAALLNRDYSEDTQQKLYSSFFEPKDTPERSTISYAQSQGVRPSAFIKREIQSGTEAGVAGDQKEDAIWENGKIVTDENGTIVSGTKKAAACKNMLSSEYTDAEKTYFYQKEYGTDDKFVLSTAAGIPVDAYLSLQSEMPNLKGVKDENGKTVSGSKKAQIKDYIYSLDMSEEQKAFLFGLQYKLSGAEASAAAAYVNNLKVSDDERRKMLPALQASSGSSGGRKGRKRKRKAVKVSVKSASIPTIKSAAKPNEILKTAMKQAFSAKSIKERSLASQKEEINNNRFLTAKQKAAAIRRLEQ